MAIDQLDSPFKGSKAFPIASEESEKKKHLAKKLSVFYNLFVVGVIQTDGAVMLSNKSPTRLQIQFSQ